MRNSRLNCWEYQCCGRGPDGSHAGTSEACPVGERLAIDGVNGGMGAGRACWVVEGTRCEGTIAGPFEEKINTCRKCAFFHRVAVEEGLDFVAPEEFAGHYRAAEPESDIAG